MTYNEERDRLGMPRYSDELADIPVITTRKGIQPLTMEGLQLANAADNAAAPGLPAKQPGQTAGTAGAAHQRGRSDCEAEHHRGGCSVEASSSGPDHSGQSPATTAARALANHRHAQAGTAVAKDARAEREIAESELRAYKNWIGKGAHSRDFEFESEQMLVRVLDPSCNFENAVFKHAADANSHAVRHDVHALMSKSFPGHAIDWVKHADWSGPQQIPAEHIDLSDKNSWAAWHDPDKVDKIAKKLRKGKPTKPMITIKVKGKNRFIVVDGHHHLLGSIKAGVIPTGYVGEIDPQYLTAALETHSSQIPKNDH